MTDEFYMREALKEAKKAARKGQWPIGCIIVLDGKIIARAHNQSVSLSHSLDHAEILALISVDKLLKQNPQTATLYTTFEPCPMCFGAILISKIKRVVSSTNPERSGAMHLRHFLPAYYRQARYAIEVTHGILHKTCLTLLQRHHPKKGTVSKKEKLVN